MSSPEFSPVVSLLIESCSSARDIQELKTATAIFRPNLGPFGADITRPTYPVPAIDLIMLGEDAVHRLFIHENLPAVLDEEQEPVLTRAGLGFFPVLGKTNHFTFREIPVATKRLAAHDTNSPHSASILARSFLAPTLISLYEASARIPAASTLYNLVHVEKITAEGGSDQLETGVRFIPPYKFEPLPSETDFVDKALQHTGLYGEEVVRQLEVALHDR